MRSEPPATIRKPFFSSFTATTMDTDILMTDAPPSVSSSQTTTSTTRLLNIKRRSTSSTASNHTRSSSGPKVPIRTTSISSPIPYHGPGGYSDPNRRYDGRRVVSGSSINRDAPAPNPKRRSRFIEEDDGSSIQSTGGGAVNNINTVNNSQNGSLSGRWGATNMNGYEVASQNGSVNSRWSQTGAGTGGGVIGGGDNNWGPAVDLKDAVSPDNPPIGFDKTAWKEYIGAIERKREEQVELMRKTLRTQEEIRAAKATPPIRGPRITELDSSPSPPISPSSPPPPSLSPFPPTHNYRIISPPLPITTPTRANTLPANLISPPQIRKRSSSLRHRFGSILSTLSPSTSNDQQRPATQSVPTTPAAYQSRPSSRMDGLRMSSPTPTAEKIGHGLQRRASMALSFFSLSTKAEIEKQDRPIEQPRKLTKPRPRSHAPSASISYSESPTPFDLLSPEEQSRITEGRRHSLTPMGNSSIVESFGPNGFGELGGLEKNGSKRGLETLEEGTEQAEFNGDGVGWGKRRKVREGWRKVGRKISGVLRTKDV